MKGGGPSQQGGPLFEGIFHNCLIYCLIIPGGQSLPETNFIEERQAFLKQKDILLPDPELQIPPTPPTHVKKHSHYTKTRHVILAPEPTDLINISIDNKYILTICCLYTTPYCLKQSLGSLQVNYAGYTLNSRYFRCISRCPKLASK